MVITISCIPNYWRNFWHQSENRTSLVFTIFCLKYNDFQVSNHNTIFDGYHIFVWSEFELHPSDLDHLMLLASHVFLFNKKSAEIGEESTHVHGLLKYNFLVFFDWPSNKFKRLEPRSKKDTCNFQLCSFVIDLWNLVKN